MIRVFLADDHPIVRDGLRQLLSREPDMTVVGEAADGRQALLAAASLAIDVLILDLSLPRVSGIEVLRRMQKDHPQIRVVVLSMYPEDQYALRLLREGAAAYLSKDHPAEELLRAVREVARGATYVSRTITERVQAGELDPEQPAHARLSAREHQVFTLLFQGRAVTDIAAELDLSASTVSNHVAKIKEKLNVRTIGEIVSYAHRAGLVDPV